ncbi:helix-turn-helix domain-containing protein [Flavobacterium sp.]
MDNQQKIKIIYRMLLEIINGNLAYRIPLEGNDSQFDELANLLNELAEKMQSREYINPYINIQKLHIPGNDPALLIIKNVQDYILNHLEEPLPSTKELSEMFGTNEFTLKESFRNFLKTSVYQYYNDERLKKSQNLIQQTNIPLKQIAFLCGFSNYNNFFKAFRKKYLISPSEVNRISNGDFSI